MRTQVRWSIALLVVFAMVIAACQPSPTPTPTPRPPTEIPTVAPTEEPTTAATEEATSAMMATEEATSAMMMTSEATMMATGEATSAMMMSPEATSSMMATTEATEVAMAPTMMMTEMASPEATSMMMMTEEPTSEMMMSPEATSMMMMTEEPTSEMMMSPEATMMMMTPEATMAMTSEVAMAPTMMMTEEPTSEMMMSPEATMMMTMEPTEAMTEMATMEATMEMTEMATMEATSMMMSTPEATMEMTPMVTMEATGPSVAGGSTVMVAADGQVVIGLAAGLSGEGIAPLGLDIQRGAELALAARPSVTVGGKTFTVKLDVQDDQCSADGGQAVGNRFASDGSIVGVVGPMCSSACRAAAPIFDAAKFTTISPSCTAPDLSTSGLTSFNRDATSDAFQGKIAAAFIYNNLGIRKIATIHDGSPYGEGLVSVVTQSFTALGGEVVAAEAVTVGDTEFRSLLEDIAAKSPELIYFGGFPAEGARLIQQRADTGLDKTLFMGADGINGTEVLNLAGSSAEGIYASKGIPASSAGLDAFLEKYKTTYGEEPPAPFHSNAYDAVNILLDAVEKTGTVDASGNLVIDRAQISKYVRSIKDYQGLTGTLNADGTGETAVSDIGIQIVKNGAFEDVAVGSTNADGSVTITDMVATPEATMSAMSTEAATMEATSEMMAATPEATP